MIEEPSAILVATHKFEAWPFLRFFGLKIRLSLNVTGQVNKETCHSHPRLTLDVYLGVSPSDMCSGP